MKNALYEYYFREKIIMKKAVKLILFLLLAGLTFTGKAVAEDIRKTGPAQAQTASGEDSAKALRKEGQENAAAKVNGVVITNESVIRQMKSMLAQKERKEAPEELRKKALDSLIFQELAWQKAKADGLTADKKTIDEAIEKVKTSYGGESGFKTFLEEESLTEEGLREMLIKSYTLKLITAREITEKVTVTEDELKQAFEKEKEKHLEPERVSVVDVIFFLKMDDADSLRKVEEVLKKINDDKERDPMRLVSDGMFIVRDVDLNKEKEPELFEAAKKLKEGELSGVIRTSDSLHLLKLKEYRPERQKTLDEVKRAIDVRLIGEARKKRLQEFEAELKKGAEIEIIDVQGSKK